MLEENERKKTADEFVPWRLVLQHMHEAARSTFGVDS
jgi:hypothetical protein